MLRLACSSAALVLVAPLLACPGGDDGSGTTFSPTTSVGTTAGTLEGTGTGGTGDPMPTTTTTESTGPSPTTTTMPDDTTGTPGDTDTTTAGSGDPGNWLITVDNGASPPRLFRADLAGGSVELCTLPATVSYTSLSFARDGTLYAYNTTQGRIDTINPCNCSFQIVGPTSLGPIALGMAASDDDGLIALHPAVDALVRVNVVTGLATVVGPLGFIFEGSSLAWSDALGYPYAIEGANDYLYDIDVLTGAANPLQPLSVDVTNPGLAVHPNDNGLYACSGDTLYSVMAATGALTPIGPLGMTGACSTLAAPQTAIECVDQL